MKAIVLWTAGAALALASCGNLAVQDDKAPEVQASPAKADEATIKSVSETLPDLVFIRVPNNPNEKPELRLAPKGVSAVSEGEIASAFEKMKAPEKVVEELDKTSSSNSWWGWRRWYGWGGYGYGNTYNTVNINNWNGYYPAYQYGGYAYPYSYSCGYPYAGGYYYGYSRYTVGWGYGYGYGGYGNYYY